MRGKRGKFKFSNIKQGVSLLQDKKAEPRHEGGIEGMGLGGKKKITSPALAK